jgi:hypothetical protein
MARASTALLLYLAVSPRSSWKGVLLRPTRRLSDYESILAQFEAKAIQNLRQVRIPLE